MSAKKQAKPAPSVVASDSLAAAYQMHLISSHEQCHGPHWSELLDMAYISPKIMRSYLREFKQGWRLGAVAYVTCNDSVVAMGLCLTVKPIFNPPTHVVAFYVQPPFRRQGFGKKLYKAVTEAAGAPTRPWHYDWDDRSHAFYGVIGIAKPDDKTDDRQGNP